MRRQPPYTCACTTTPHNGDADYRASLATVTNANLEALLLRRLRVVTLSQDEFVRARTKLVESQRIAGDIEQVLRSRGELSERVAKALRDTYPVGP